MSEKELTYGETIKQPFPKLEDEEVVAEFKGTYREGSTKGSVVLSVEGIGLACGSPSGESECKVIIIKLKQTNPHTEIKAEYEKAIADGKIVKIFATYKERGRKIKAIEHPGAEWRKNDDYQLRYYNIDWDKLLSLSYANGEFIGVMLDDNSDFRREYKTELRGIEGDGNFLDEWGSAYKYCRLAKGVEIKDEWLKEIK